MKKKWHHDKDGKPSPKRFVGVAIALIVCCMTVSDFIGFGKVNETVLALLVGLIIPLLSISSLERIKK